MVNMYMIDTNSMGIPMIYEIQKDKCFPLPTFDLETPNRVIVTVYGKVLDSNYTQLLHANGDLDLRTVSLLDQVQKEKIILEFMNLILNMFIIPKIIPLKIYGSPLQIRKQKISQK